MMKITMLPKFIIATVFLCMPLTGQAQADYEERGGVVVIEAESLSGPGWVVESDKSKFDNFSGTGYLRSKTKTGNRDNDALKIKVKINSTGKYIFKWRVRVGTGTSNGDANDSWVKITGNNVDFFAERGNSKVYPKGYEGEKINETAIIPNDRGPGIDGWFKVYSSGGVPNWVWFGRTWDFDSHALFANFPVKGEYTIHIAHRSLGNLIDRIVLSKNASDIDSSDDAKSKPPIDAETPENDFRLAVSTFDLSKSGIAIYPNPAQGFLNIKGLKNTTAKIDLIDALGRVLPADMQQQNTNTIRINTTTLAPGLYFVRIGQLGQSAFVVK